MRVRAAEIRGITAESVDFLKGRGITHSDHLLEAARNPEDRRNLADAMRVPPAHVLELANRADLARIKGIGLVFSDLLENAGVDTVKELAHRVPENLHAKLVQINTEQKLAGRMPRLEEVQDWVNQAKELPKILEY
jgi:predicted flap endonuclease-1-like 5' DNA nuclease